MTVTFLPLIWSTSTGPFQPSMVTFFGFEVRGRFVGQQTAHFLGQFTETLGADVAFAHQADLVLDQGVFDFNDFHYYLLNWRKKIAESYNKSHGL